MELVKSENAMLRKCFIRNIREFNKKDKYDFEADELYADFNKAVNESNNFIFQNMDRLE